LCSHESWPFLRRRRVLLKPSACFFLRGSIDGYRVKIRYPKYWKRFAEVPGERVAKAPRRSRRAA
jgi:hypothetical protein